MMSSELFTCVTLFWNFFWKLILYIGSTSDGCFLCLSNTKDATDHIGDVKAPTAEPNKGEPHVNSASGIQGYLLWT
jgi:hypothetical protein